MLAISIKVKGLVDRAIQVEHEMHAEIAHVLQHLETLPARAAHVEVDDELIHHPLQERQVPPAAAHLLDLVGAEAAAAHIVAIGRTEAADFRLRGFPIGLVERAEAPFHAVGVVAARIHPQHHARAGVDELAGGDDLVPGPGREGARPWGGLAAGKQGHRGEHAENLDWARRVGGTF
jgi:hypothetical protein